SQDMRITGKKNPLPSMLYGIDSEGNPKPVNVDDNGNVLTQLTGSIEEYALPVREVGRAVEVIRNYSHTVTNAGNHSAGDVFRRGNDVPALDISNYKNIIISIINTGVGSTNIARVITYTCHGNVSGDE